MPACAASRATSAPPSDRCPALTRQHAARDPTLVIAQATSLGRRRVRPLACAATESSTAITGRGTLDRKKLILVVIDGLTPEVFEDAVENESRAGARVSRTPRQLPPRRLHLSLADAGVPLVDRHRRASGRAPDPAPRLVEPRRAAPGRVRLVVRGDQGRGARRSLLDAVFNMNEQHLGRDAVDRLRGARGRRPDDGRREHHLLPRAHAARARRARPDPPGLRAEAVLLLQLVRVGGDGRAGRRLRPLDRLDRRVRRLRRPLARDPRRLRPARLLPARLRLRLARTRARGATRRRSGAAMRRSER